MTHPALTRSLALDAPATTTVTTSCPTFGRPRRSIVRRNITVAETTGIAWTDATANFWEGCTKVGPGCDACYAEARDQRYHAGSHWGPGAPRKRMADATFNRPLVWNRNRLECNTIGEAAYAARYPKRPIPPIWVFSQSLSDMFDNAVDPAWRAAAWAIIRECKALRWQLVTKRVGNVRKMLPDDWGDGSEYAHVGIIATVVTQAEAERDVPKLTGLKGFDVKWVGLSIEPQLERIELRRLDVGGGWQMDALAGVCTYVGDGIEVKHAIGATVDDAPLDWVICGGESQQAGHQARLFDWSWGETLLADCLATGVPFFMKQSGDLVTHTNGAGSGPTPWRPKESAGGDPAEWPAHMRVRQMPEHAYGWDSRP
jgi:protein gp37